MGINVVIANAGTNHKVNTQNAQGQAFIGILGIITLC